ncbi:hypothetical protein VTK73DRAFT_7924 [Phialemonium thermophilum]|uniref:Uncharacterized protein n=1 Tax=Phialemonium thermophilum TaxID=223376 RepID=A0ABR3WBN4_9PEZI
MSSDPGSPTDSLFGDSATQMTPGEDEPQTIERWGIEECGDLGELDYPAGVETPTAPPATTAVLTPQRKRALSDPPDLSDTHKRAKEDKEAREKPAQTPKFPLTLPPHLPAARPTSPDAQHVSTDAAATEEEEHDELGTVRPSAISSTLLPHGLPVITTAQLERLRSPIGWLEDAVVSWLLSFAVCHRSATPSSRPRRRASSSC